MARSPWPSPPPSVRKPRQGRRSAEGGGEGASRGEPPSEARGSAEEAPGRRRRTASRAGWGGVARKGAGRVRDEGAARRLEAFAAAVPRGVDAWEPEGWIDEGEVRSEAARPSIAVGREVPSRRPARPTAAAARRLAAPPASARRRRERVDERLKEPAERSERERYEEARAILRPLADAPPRQRRSASSSG